MSRSPAATERSFRSLPLPMQSAMEAAFESARAGSLAIGATVVDHSGAVVSTGRNRLHESDIGGDHVAGTSLAHAEINALAKLRFRAHEGDELELHTTLQPCLQCLGAIRLSPIRRVTILAPDPLWTGVENIRSVNPWIGQRWPTIVTLPATEWSVLALVSPTRHALDHPVLAPLWRAALPLTSELAETVDLGALDGGSIPDRVAAVWGDLAGCVAEVEGLAVESRRAQS